MCGILGIFLADYAEQTSSAMPSLAADCLTALQHRGTESTGLVGSDGTLGNHFDILKGHGLVRDVYTAESLAALKGCKSLIGHNRYSTAGMKAAINCIQPFILHTTVGLIAIAHNGELVNARSRRAKVLREGVGLSTDTDSELIGQIIAKTIAQNMKCREHNKRAYGDISSELSATMSAIDLSYALLVMTYDRIYALRDPYGNRPLCIGKLQRYTDSLLNTSNGSLSSDTSNMEMYGYIAASETCAYPPGTEHLFEVAPGEIMEISKNGVNPVWQMMAKPLSFCIFEYVYFARADSMFEGQQVHAVRMECGKILAEEDSIDADIVCTVPESATAASMGYAQKSGIRFEQVLQRNTYVGRSFIQPSTHLRQKSVLKKFGVLTHNVIGKRIILVDDSIVRGNTMGIIVKMLRQHGAKEVHLRIASPPLKYPCYMGINIPSTDELLACQMNTIEGIAIKLQADSVRYLSVEGLRRAVQNGITLKGNKETGHCMACLTGEYPVPIEI